MIVINLISILLNQPVYDTFEREKSVLSEEDIRCSNKPSFFTQRFAQGREQTAPNANLCVSDNPKPDNISSLVRLILVSKNIQSLFEANTALTQSR